MQGHTPQYLSLTNMLMLYMPFIRLIRLFMLLCVCLLPHHIKAQINASNKAKTPMGGKSKHNKNPHYIKM